MHIKTHSLLSPLPYILSAAFLLPLSAYSAIQVQGTRFIYPAKKREITVSLQNTTSSPALVQSWLDKGNPSSQPGEIKVPFVILPPVTRVEPHRGQTLRISYIGGALPQNKETVFWLNVLDIPPDAKSLSGKNKVQFAFRSRLKLFYRPANLKGSPEDAAKQMKWSVIQSNKGYALQAKNNSAYYVSFGKIGINQSGRKYNSDSVGGMIGPGETKQFHFSGLRHIAGGQVDASWINDFGGSREIKYPL